MAREYVLQKFQQKTDLQIDYRNELNDQQYAAVTAEPGPALVIAGAGSGKTRTLTYRVAYLLEQGISPDRILLLTFTNKASKEMMTRVGDLLGGGNEELWGGTFHSIGHRILRRFSDRIGYRRDFSILDSEDSRDLLKACIGASEIDVKATRFPKADVVKSMISLSVNTGMKMPDVLEMHYKKFVSLTYEITGLLKAYAERKRETNVMDFDDLMVLWLRLLEDDEAVRERLQDRFQFVLVDEYQDTNQVQCNLIDLIGAKHRNVMVVGDDSQSIYSWRGADFRNIFEFPRRYKEAKEYRIEVNYRSTPEILQLANESISLNVQQFSKELKAARKSGQKPALVVCGDAYEQAGFISQRVLELRDEGIELMDIAILYRSHFHAMELQMELTKRNIPFAITSGLKFFEQAHIKDVAAYLKLIANPRDEVSFKRVVLMMPGIGAKGADKLWLMFRDRCTDMLAEEQEEESDPDWSVDEDWETAQEAGEPSPSFAVAESLRELGVKVPKKSVEAWRQFGDTVAQMEEIRDDASKQVRLLLDAGYEEYLTETFNNGASRIEDVVQLENFANQFNSVEDFLAQLSLMTDAEKDGGGVKDDEFIKLSSIHQAKGLEFKVVFVIMLCDGLFPSGRSFEDPAALEEERRLFYVAVTRAEDELYLTYPLIRLAQGYGGDAVQKPSRFIEEVHDDDFIEEWNIKGSSGW
ncbi:UvrD-helicase domain-containing protein [Verrucomicrobia bacterium]|nr:UvrD-helicase domain-containing protein [Verrucomicrobiota bacterium]